MLRWSTQGRFFSSGLVRFRSLNTSMSSVCHFDAALDGRLVTVVRRKGWDRINGRIARFSTTWVLMAVEVDAGFDGHALIRRSDVRRVDPQPSAAFVQKALAAEGHWPLPGLDDIDLAATRSVLRSAAQVAPVVSVYYEQDHADECLIGIPHDFGRRKFKLQNVTPQAEWDGDAVFHYRCVSRIGLGGAYERRLAAVAGAALSPDGRRAAGGET